MEATPAREAARNENVLAHLGGRILIVLTSGFRQQTFLGNPLLPAFLRLVPRSRRKDVALRLLGISPHYFTERRTGRYPATMPQRLVLEREFARNVDSRRVLFEDVVAPHLAADMAALDYGCGVGILASEMARRCRSVTAVDISVGALACGRILFPDANLHFVRIGRKRIDGISDASLDLITSFAVLQHMDDLTMERTLGEFRRTLKPGRLALCHIPLKESEAATARAAHHVDRHSPILRMLQRQYGLLMLYREREAVDAAVIRNGFSVVSCKVIGTLSRIEDDIAHQHLFVLRADA